MTDRDRLAADITAAWPLGKPEMLMEPTGNRTWRETPLHVETPVGATYPPIDPFIERATAIVKAYREDEG